MHIKKLNQFASLPVRATEMSAGYDLFANLRSGNENKIEIISPGETKKIGTGIAVAVPRGYFGAVFARSGLATKQGLRPANCVGVIDSDYRGEVIVPVHNDSGERRYVNHGDRIAQLILIPYAFFEEIEEMEDLDETERGSGGFGSTGYHACDECRTVWTDDLTQTAGKELWK